MDPGPARVQPTPNSWNMLHPPMLIVRALWPLLDGIWGVLEGSWGVLVDVGSIAF